jgi:hypothetical protein
MGWNVASWSSTFLPLWLISVMISPFLGVNEETRRRARRAAHESGD